MTINNETILDIAFKIVNEKLHLQNNAEIMYRILEITKQALGIERCLFWEVRDSDCEIMAGLPKGGHKFVKGPLNSHPDIKAAVFSPCRTMVINDPLENGLTEYFIDIVKKYGINAIFYAVGSCKHVTAVFVADATGKKMTFFPDEEDACRNIAELMAALLVDTDEFLLVLRKMTNSLSRQDDYKYLRDRLVGKIAELGCVDLIEGSVEKILNSNDPIARKRLETSIQIVKKAAAFLRDTIPLRSPA